MMRFSGWANNAPVWVMAAVAGLCCAAVAQAQGIDAPERAADKADKMICKRFIETGSLVKGYRTCKTKREWERERDNIRSTGVASGGCNSAESGNCMGSTTVAGVVRGVPN